MNAFHRLHALRMENDAAGFAMQELAPRFARMDARHENGTAPQAVVVHQLFQTPPALARRLVDLLDPEPGSRILEPSAGLGRLLDHLPPTCETVAVEIAPACAGVLFHQQRQNLTIKQRDFLTLTPADLGTFDAIAMNPPFTMRADIRHILHALQFLKPGGRLAALCLAGPQRTTALRHLAQEWIELPPGTFASSGTQVATVLMLITA